ncbi:terminase TerL endonuclease subunit [Sagittula sp. MA-2]|jgi:phage terminase large subunit-like protein|uniref:terminase TerL endonuclease subunit n=1 Tax=Sagittula sp. MA-2 TaxID=3048007 RepID=UPI0024C4319A|nr:terminase TerL endonuclease subunit [Sagittula sp. MA-2]WHZ37508.1 terminase large subunit [Sagittula sp. MA-2]
MDGTPQISVYSMQGTRRRKRPTPEVRFANWLRREFIVPAGVSAGQPFELYPFQQEFVRELLARDGAGPRWRTLIYSTGRKNGKTYLLAAVLLGLMCPDSPIAIPRFTGAVSAPSERHALFIAKAMQALMEAAGRAKESKRRADPKPGQIFIGTANLLLSTGTRAQGHGADLDLAVIDEGGLITRNQEELITGFFDALASKNGQLVLTGTRGDSPQYNEMLERPDPRTYVCLHSATKEDDAADPETWKKANPGLGPIKSLSFMRDAHTKAAQSGDLREFRAWHLNESLSPQRELLLDYDSLVKAYRDAPQTIPGEPVHVGIDLGGSASMTAATIAYEQSGVVKVLGAFPGADINLLDRGKRDQVGDLWHRCAKAGELIETSGSVSDLAEFLPEVIARIGPHPVRSVSCDRYRQAEWETAMARARLSWPVLYRGTGPKDGDADIRATRRLFLAGAIQMQRSVLLEGSLAEADVKVSTTGACQLSKSHLHARIDVAQSLVLACSAMLRARDAVQPTYEVEVL